jgi:putative Holliday junction resolvase
LPVHEVDERYSTVEVQSAGAHDLDAAAAAVILQQFLDQQA